MLRQRKSFFVGNFHVMINFQYIVTFGL